MKPNHKQKEIFKIIEEQAKFWQQTNDIDSPTHYSDIDSDFNNCEHLSEENKEKLTDLFIAE